MPKHFRSFSFILAAVFLLPYLASAEKWALIVAGSNGFWNYRHQADVCHMYHILNKNDIPDSNIVVFMYDDIAFNSLNPNQGVIINELNGPNLYPGVPKDYTGMNVTAQNVLAVLAGKDMTGIGSGKTIASSGEDELFIYLTDHGAPDMSLFCLFAMPTGDYLYATELMKTFQFMHENKKYSQITIYIEACESGSMFLKLPDNLNIYAVSASSPSESSWACILDNTLDTYLSDCFSQHFLENDDAVNPHQTTLGDQLTTVQTLTNTSTVCAYGSLDMENEFLSQFISESTCGACKSSEILQMEYQQKLARRASGELNEGQPMNVRDVEFKFYERKLGTATARWNALQQTANDNDFNSVAQRASAGFEMQMWQEKVNGEIKMRRKHIAAYLHLLHVLGLPEPRVESTVSNPDPESCSKSSPELVGSDCLMEAVAGAEKACGKFTEWSLQFVRNLNVACNAGISSDRITSLLEGICTRLDGPAQAMVPIVAPIQDEAAEAGSTQAAASASANQEVGEDTVIQIITSVGNFFSYASDEK